MINKLSEEIHAINVKNGFFEDEKNIGEMLCLVHSEVSEALEADRKGLYYPKEVTEFNVGMMVMSKFSNSNEYAVEDSDFKSQFEKSTKDTFEDELADIMIRVMDLAKFKGINLEEHIKAKMRYNSLREYKHGKKY